MNSLVYISHFYKIPIPKLLFLFNYKAKTPRYSQSHSRSSSRPSPMHNRRSSTPTNNTRKTKSITNSKLNFLFCF